MCTLFLVISIPHYTRHESRRSNFVLEYAFKKVLKRQERSRKYVRKHFIIFAVIGTLNPSYFADQEKLMELRSSKRFFVRMPGQVPL